MRTDVTFPGSGGQMLPARLYHGDSGSRRAVIFSHGLFSTRDGYKITGLADDITSTGCHLLAFNFSCTPEAGGSYEQISIAREIEDLAGAVRFVLSRGIGEIHLMGSSMGAAVTLLYAGESDFHPCSLILIAAPVWMDRVLSAGLAGIADISSLPERGLTMIEGIPVGNGFFRECASRDIAAVIPSLDMPALVFHGEKDMVVPVENGRYLAGHMGGPVNYVEIPGGDHNLISTDSMDILRRDIVRWLGGVNSCRN